MIETLFSFLSDVERLKLVERRAYVSDLSRHENSAEHSWHMTLGLLVLARELNLDLDLSKAVKMALVHDLCEIDAGDISIFDPRRAEKGPAELACILRLAEYDLQFAAELRDLWMEYEAQESLESRWVRVLDRLMPFMTNLMTKGQTWRDQHVTRSQVLRINEPVQRQAPEIYEWMRRRLDEAVAEGWLLEA